MNKVLIHACCAICLGYPLKKLQEMGYEVIVLFYNPNISPNEEYERRKSEVVRFCSEEGVELLLEEDTEDVFLSTVKGFENEPERGERCRMCFGLRLDKTAQIAQKMGISAFSTTLSVSPHKNYEQIKDVAHNLADKYSIDFIDLDFKKQNGFKITNEIANVHGFYRQKYCGCVFSIN